MVMDLCRENGNPEPDFEMRIDGLIAMMYPVVAEALHISHSRLL